MFEDLLAEPVILKVPSGTFSDGETQYSEYAAYALISDFTSRDLKTYGNIKNGKIFLLRCTVHPEPDSRIIHDEKIYDLKEIKVCRDLDGEIECYRCVVM
ncbi:MAG: hypothetical protein PHV59_11635 [Victivallales bacterium]|nr:hypothetical protein [Victivallales bacterium]